MITDCSITPQPDKIDCDICIIGSGCGGATAAMVLAQAGRDVLVLEEGGDFQGQLLTQRDAAMYDQLYVDRGGRTTEDMAIGILSGRVLGGGGVINACDVVPISDALLEFWRKHRGLTDLTAEFVRPFAEQAMSDLAAHKIVEKQVNRANGLLRQGTEALGLRGELMMHNRDDSCAGLGSCLIGCPIGAKRNPRTVAIPKAMAAGARFLTRARAVKIVNATKELKQIQCRTLDSCGYREQERFSVQARTVLVAANPIGTVQLLLRSGIGNDNVGKFLSLQPQIPILAHFTEQIDAFNGIPQAYAVTQFETCDNQRGLGGFRIEAIMGTPGIVGSLVPHAGLPGKTMMAQLRHVAASLLLLPDESVGTIRLGAGDRPVVRYELTEEYRIRARQAIRAAAKIYLAAGALEVVVADVPPLVLKKDADLAKIDALTFAPATMPFISAHQQGGVRMAANERDGAAAPNGQVYGTRGVYVFDSSGFPSSSSSHTMAPIVTMARLQAGRFLAEARG